MPPTESSQTPLFSMLGDLALSKQMTLSSKNYKFVEQGRKSP